MSSICRNFLLILLGPVLCAGWFSSDSWALDNLDAGLELNGNVSEFHSVLENKFTTELLNVCVPSSNQLGIIGYTLAEPQKVAVCIFDQQGSEVIQLLDSTETSGLHRISWDGCQKDGRVAGSGIYFLMLKTDESVILRRLVLE